MRVCRCDSYGLWVGCLIWKNAIFYLSVATISGYIPEDNSLVQTDFIIAVLVMVMSGFRRPCPVLLLHHCLASYILCNRLPLEARITPLGMSLSSIVTTLKTFSILYRSHTPTTNNTTTVYNTSTNKSGSSLHFGFFSGASLFVFIRPFFFDARIGKLPLQTLHLGYI